MHTYVFAALVSLTTAAVITTNAGQPIDDEVNSQTVNVEGPILLQDQWLVEHLAIHNRERIPERNVHARGAVAKGYFETTADWMANYTFAKFLEGSGIKTPVACRFSTVIHSVGSPEFLRDPRGFALKLYTQEGNYDIVGLNFPVFFIRDGIRFPDMIRSLKPNPVNGVQEWWRIWDYFSNFPESTHMFTWLMDDMGIPASYREMNGWGVHTYKWISKAGKEMYVRYYYSSDQGVKNLMDDEAVMKMFSFATADLFDNIKNGKAPSWTVQVQMMDPDDKEMIDSLNFDPLDTTKQWPEDQFPFRTIGKLVLDENPISQFLENEQAAFSPSRLVPGIEPSNEKMLQTRLFAYGDTQRYRLGVNYQMLPINAPKCPFLDAHLDGRMNFLQQQTLSAQEVNYFPSTVNKTKTFAPKYNHETEEIDTGKKIRQMINKTNDFTQPGERYRSFDADRQNRLAQRIAATLVSERISQDVVQIWLGYWTEADADLATKIKQYMNGYEQIDFPHRTNGRVQLSAAQRQQLIDFRSNFFRSSGSRA